jgi:hypothetical protein
MFLETTLKKKPIYPLMFYSSTLVMLYNLFDLSTQYALV